MSTQARALSVGAILNQTYEILEFVAEGGTGEIYRAKNLATGKVFAIKVLKDVFSKDEAYHELMKRELISEVIHPAVVRYYDIHRSSAGGGFLFIVMEFIEGVSLAELMRKGPVSTKDLLEIGRAISSGLKAAHLAGVLHRDISPDNILLRGGDPSAATLIDFGIAKDMKPDARTVVGSTFAGKYEYAAPEQLSGKADERSDVYALGATLLAAARGKIPELPEAPMAFNDYKTSHLDVSGLEARLATIISECVEPNIERRLQNSTEMLRAFNNGKQDGGFGFGLEVDEEPQIDTDFEEDLERGAGGKRNKSSTVWIAIVGAVFAVIALVFLTPLKEVVLGTSVPTAVPYLFEADRASRTLTGHAPDEVGKTELIQAAGKAFSEAPLVAVTVANGAPVEAWSSALAAVITTLAPAKDWKINAVNERLIVLGEVPSSSDFDAVLWEIKRIAEESGFNLESKLKRALPEVDSTLLAEIAQAYSDCGSLAVSPSAGTVKDDQTIVVTGTLSSSEQRDDMREELSTVSGGREIHTDIRLLNQSVCRLRSLLPPKRDTQMAIVIGDGGRDRPISGETLTPTTIPVIDVVIPADIDGYLYGFLVDNEGAVVHMLPHNMRRNHTISTLGTVSDNRRTISLTYPWAGRNKERFSIKFAEPHGANLVFGVITRQVLFGGEIRPRVENIDAFAPELARQLRLIEQRGGNVIQAQRMIVVQE